MANNTMELKYLVDYRQLQLANKEILKTGSNAQKSASVFEQSFRKFERENARQLSDVKKKIAFSQRMEAQKAKEARETQRAADQEAKSLERLKVKYVQGHLAMEIYTKELNDLATARQANIITAEQHRVELERLNTATKMGTVVSDEYGDTVGQVGRRMSRTGVMYQQAGYQVGDFIVQVQSGQNAMVAFGQQATQMAGTLTLLGGKFIGIGTVLGIAIPLLTAAGAVLMRTRESAKDAADGAKTFEDSLKSARSEVSGMEEDLRLLASGFEGMFRLTLEDQVRLAAEEVEVLQQRLEQLQVSTPGDRSGAAAELKEQEVEDAREALSLATRELANAIELSRQEKERQREASVTNQLLKVREATQRRQREEAEQAARVNSAQTQSFEEQIDLLRLQLIYGKESENVRNLERVHAERAYVADLRREGLSQEQIDALLEQRNITIQLADAVKKAEEASAELRSEIGDAAVKALELAGVDIASPISNAAKEAAILAARLGIGLAAAQGIMQAQAGRDVDFMNLQGQYAAYGQGQQAMRQAISDQVHSVDGRAFDLDSSGGGGGSSADALASLMKRIALDEQLLGVSRERAQVMRAIANSERQYSASAIEGAVQRLEAYNQEKDRLAEIQGLYDATQSSLEEGFMSMVDGTKTVEDAFKDMARSIIKQLYEVLVVQRMVGSFKPGVGGSGIMGLIGNIFGKASGGTVMSNQPYLVGEKGPEIIVPQNRGHVMNADLTSQAMGGGSVVVHQSFHFQANGDESVKKLIAQAAPQIANMAKQSVVDSRRRGGAMKNAFG